MLISFIYQKKNVIFIILQYENVCNQCDNLTTREASLVSHISSLEKQLQQNLPRKPSPPPSASTPNQHLNLELQHIQQQLQLVTDERKQFEEQLTTQVLFL